MEFWVVRQGPGAQYAAEMLEQGFIGVDFIGDIDLTAEVQDGEPTLRRTVMDLYEQQNPTKSKIAAGLAAGNTVVLATVIDQDAVVIVPKQDRSFAFGRVVGPYEFHPGTPLPHRRPVEWRGSFLRGDMSEALMKASNATVTVFTLTPHAAELLDLTAGQLPGELQENLAAEAEVQEELAFRLEKQLEDFLVDNWARTPLGREYDIYEEDGQPAGRQYRTDTGPMDILAISKDRKKLLVVELKRDRASDVVVGQVQRYMGYVMDELLESGQVVEGVIIAAEDDQRIRRALRVTQNIRFMKYHVSFELEEVMQ